MNREVFDYTHKGKGGGVYGAIAYLTRWDGPVNESTDPYPNGTWTDSEAFPAVKHVQNVILLPQRSDRADTGNIKGSLKKWGAAYTAFTYNKTCYNNVTSAYYEPADSLIPVSIGGHSVTIVGWNDTYPAANFNTLPPGDGAWIVKNSWGTNWGDQGFFYVSYYDKFMGSAVVSKEESKNTAVFLAEPVDNYAQVYYYDPLGECKDLYFKTKQKGTIANKFTASMPGTLQAIGFYTTDLNTGYEAKIYRNPTTGPIGETPAAEFNGTLQFMGYHTVPIPSGIEASLQTGDTFSVVLTLSNPINEYYAAVELPLANYSSNATGRPGESYYSPDLGKTFTDLTTDLNDANFCIKAYTKAGTGTRSTTGA